MGFSIGDIHPAIIHFPIVLIFMAFVFDIIYWYNRRQIFQSIAAWILIIAALILLPTALTGLFAKDFYPAGDPDVSRHQTMALITIIYTLIYALFRGYAYFKEKIFSVYLYLLLGLINVGLVNMTAEYGGIVVRGKGIGMESARPDGYPLPYGHVDKK